MKTHKKHKILSASLYSLVILFVCYAILFVIDRNYGERKKTEVATDSLEFSCGDILFKETSFIMAYSKHPQYGCLPGHLGIILNDTTIAALNYNLNNLIVAESSSFNIKKKKILPILKINSAESNFEYAAGRLFLIKTHLNNSEKMKLIQFSKLNVGKPYRIFSSKSDTAYYNCSTFVWHAFKNATGKDIDANGGGNVLPVDILNYYIKEKAKIIRF